MKKVFFSLLLSFFVINITNVNAELDYTESKFKLYDEMYEVVSSSDTSWHTTILTDYHYEQSFGGAKEYLINTFYNHPNGVSATVKKMYYDIQCNEINPCVIKYSFTYYDEPELLQYLKSEINNIVAPVINSTFENKVKFVNNFIKERAYYSNDTKGSEHSAYTLYVEGKGDSQAYAVTAQMMFTALGVENYILIGNVYGEAHFWNVLFSPKGDLYHLDVTWNDLNTDTYYLLTTADLNSKNTHEYSNYPLEMIKVYRLYKFGNEAPENPDEGPGTDEPEEEFLSTDSLPLDIRNELNRFMNDKSNSKDLGHLGGVDSTKILEVKFNDLVGNNFTNKIYIINENGKILKTYAYSNEKRVLIAKENDIFYRGEYTLVILRGVNSMNSKMKETTKDYFVKFIVE